MNELSTAKVDTNDVKRDSASNRRNDEELRSAVDSVQRYLFDPDASDKLYETVLLRVMNMTGSCQGSVIVINNEVSSRLGGKEYQVKVAGCFRKTIENQLISADIKSHLNLALLTTHINNQIIGGLPIFFNSPIPFEHRRLLANPNSTASLMLMPIISQNVVRGLLVLTKVKDDFKAEQITRLMPLLGAASCVLRTAESVKGDFPQLDKTIENNHYLSSFIAASPLAVLVVREDGVIIASNLAAESVFTNNAPLVTGSKIRDFLPNYDSLFQWSNQESELDYKNHHSAPRLWEDQTALRKDGREFLANISIFRYSEGMSKYTTLQLQDITSMRASAEEYRRTSQHFSALKHLVPVGILHVDSHWNCIYANDMWFELSGLLADESANEQWINAIHESDIQRLLEDLSDSMKVGADYSTEVRLITPLGKVRWVEFNARTLFGESGYIQGFLATIGDITERLETQEHLKHVAEYDSLTGLANKNLLKDRLQQAFYNSERDHCELTVMFIDLDGFKDVNDTLGHDVGDKLLIKVGERLQNVLRRNDTVARFGGDEFVILLGINEHENIVATVANKIVDEIARPYYIGEEEIYVTASIGIAHGNSEDSSPQRILKEADTALYLAKREGKNNFQTFNHELDFEAKARINMINGLRSALERDDFFITYQTQALMGDLEIIGVEALLRYRHPEKGIIQPVDFISLLEETGLIVDVGKWVIEHACRQLKTWQDEEVFPKDGFISINVSPRQLSDNSIVTIIKDACESYKVKPENLVIEITESVLINKATVVKDILSELKELGVRLALDDFGTGYSSLSYLQNYPFDHIKIDKSFVLDILTDSNDEKIIRGIIALVQSLGLKVTAEGVESRGALAILQECGCDYFQGYYLSKPLLAEKLDFNQFAPMMVS